MLPNNFVNTLVTRIYCNTCSCGAKENSKLFPELTNAKVASALTKITKKTELVQWLGVNQIRISRDRNEWKFSHGVCKSVQNKLRLKIVALKIDSFNHGDLFDTGDNLLPAGGPDDIPPAQAEIYHEGVTLNFEDPVQTVGTNFPLPNKGWNWEKATDSAPIFY